jgi:hypothetical protein
MPVMPSRAAEPAAGSLAHREDHHESFLVYKRFRYLKIATATAAAAILLYLYHSPYGSPYGGTWVGYLLGTAGALLILWLMWFGYRKRSYTRNQGKLKAWLSAHVYLGLALVVIGTLHTGFHFGWNIHTTAYVLMCLVIASGAFGVFCYSRYPRLMTDNRRGTAMPQMLGRIAALNDELRAGAMTLDDATALLVTRATESTFLGGPWRQQLSGRYPNCATALALVELDRMATAAGPERPVAIRQVRVLLDEKAQLLARARRDISYKGMMDIWLYFHVPMSFALLAALLAHVVSIFFYW